MITNKRTTFTIRSPEEVNKYLDDLRKDFDSSEYLFIIPEEVKDNNLKQVYKVGFLKSFYERLYPDYSKSKIYGIINREWQVFVGTRQMERNCVKYSEIVKNKGGF